MIKSMTKKKVLGAQSLSMVSMARMWESSRHSWDSLLTTCVKIPKQKEVHFKIANLEIRDIGVITEQRRNKLEC